MTSLEGTFPFWLEECCQRLKSMQEADADDSTALTCHLNLNLRRLDVPMMRTLAQSLHYNEKLQFINLTSALGGNRASSDDILEPLAEVLSTQKSLRVLHLSYNRLRNIDALGKALSKNTCLEELYLDHNQLGPEGACALARGIAANPSSRLRILCLSSNRIGDVSGQALAGMLVSNTSIETLRLSRNGLGFATANALYEVLESSRNLSLSCLILKENPELELSDNLSKIFTLVQANKAGRYLLRQEHNSPAVGVWPHVLEGMDLSPQFYMVRQIAPHFA